MEVTRTGFKLTLRQPVEHFTGRVGFKEIFRSPSGISVVYASFAPCARNDWHTHPLGQTLIVTSGRGYVQSWGARIRVIRPGDVIWCPPGEKHWHGASREAGMSHIAIQEALDGRIVDWMEPVSDEQYQRRVIDK